jgi:hypothetical protein
MVSGYRKYVSLEQEELDRLAGAMMIRQLVFVLGDIGMPLILEKSLTDPRAGGRAR